jgi:hypothetical protein
MERFVLLARMSDLAAARVAAARLESEGVTVRLHGEALGPYRLTVGAMATTELWVPESALTTAREVMLESEVDAVLGTVDAPRSEHLPSKWVLTPIALAILAAFLLRLAWQVF